MWPFLDSEFLFSLDFTFNISGLISKHPLFFIEFRKDVIVNSQIGVGIPNV